MKFHMMFHPKLLYLITIKDEQQQAYEMYRYRLCLSIYGVSFCFLNEHGIDPAMPQPTKLTVGGML